MSRQYTELKRNINKIKKTFCTKMVINNQTTERSQLMLKAYLALVHAEFEWFIETRIKNVLDDSLNKYNISKTIDQHIGSVLAYSYKTKDVESKDFIPFEQIVNKECVDFKKRIKKNNGITLDNITPLLKKIGYDINSISHQTELTVLRGFAADRGDIVHCSTKVSRLINFQDETEKMENILLVCKDIDDLLPVV